MILDQVTLSWRKAGHCAFDSELSLSLVPSHHFTTSSEKEKAFCPSQSNWSTLPVLLLIKRAEGKILRNGYVVILKDGPGVASMDSIANSIPYSNITDKWPIVHGFTVILTEDDPNKLRTRMDILPITENAAVRTTAKQ